MTLSIRPEALRIVERAPSGGNSFSGRIASQTYLGEVAQYQLEAADGSRLKLFELNPQVERKPGEQPLTLCVDSDDAIILPR